MELFSSAGKKGLAIMIGALLLLCNACITVCALRDSYSLACKYNTPWFLNEVFADCCCQRLANFPQNLPKNTVELDLSYNSITTIPHLNLPRLKAFDISYNKLIKEAADDMSDHILSELVSLKLAGNQLIKLPRHLPKSLLHLDFSNNGITNLNRAILVTLPALQYLDLCNNFLTTITKESFCPETAKLEVSKSLKYLDLSKNTIYNINQRAFECMKNLRNLNLSYNSLTAVSENHFTGLSSLNSLDLSCNSIIQISPTAFTSLKNLLLLNLARNRIHVPPQNLPETLFLIDLSNNEICTLNEETNLLFVNRVIMVNNPLKCNTGLQWIKAHLIDSASMPEDSACPHTVMGWIQRRYATKQPLMPRCSSPLNLAGRFLDTVTDEELAQMPNPFINTSLLYKKSMTTPLINPRVAKSSILGMFNKCPDGSSDKKWFEGKAINATSIAVQWDVEPDMDQFDLQIMFYKFGCRNSSRQVTVQATKGIHIINHLKPNTNYMVCIIPLCNPSDSSSTLFLDMCLEILTNKLPLHKRFFKVLLGGCPCCASYVGSIVLIMLVIGLYLMSGYLIRIFKITRNTMKDGSRNS